jgi:CheY-like chemotaxis protein
VVRDLVVRMLSREGFRVTTAEDGQSGLKLASELRPDAITLDVNMPGPDGWQVLTELKGNAALADIPVVLMTIHDDRQAAFALGASDYVPKPIDSKLLLRALERHVPSGIAKKRVLVVDDDAAVRDHLRSLLTQAGVEVDEAPNGKVALDRLAANAPALVLLDLNMPEMDGFEFLRSCRADSRYRSLPIIVVTARDLSSEERALLSREVSLVVEKGEGSLDALLSDVKTMIGTRARASSART